jgi:hypothetical protein
VFLKFTFILAPVLFVRFFWDFPLSDPQNIDDEEPCARLANHERQERTDEDFLNHHRVTEKLSYKVKDQRKRAKERAAEKTDFARFYNQPLRFFRAQPAQEGCQPRALGLHWLFTHHGMMLPHDRLLFERSNETYLQNAL